MLSVYGIMAQACSECNFQFLTLQSFEHHKLLQRCETYKSNSPRGCFSNVMHILEIPIPEEKRQDELMKQMRETLQLYKTT